MDKFKITGGGGFHLTIGEYTISVQWGPGTYCSHHRNFDYGEPQTCRIWESPDAEAAVWDSNGTWRTEEVIKESLNQDADGDVIGWVTPLEVGKIISWITKQAEKANK